MRRQLFIGFLVTVLTSALVHAHSLKTQMQLGQLLPDSRENTMGLLLFILIMVLPFYICWVVQKSRDKSAKEFLHNRQMRHLENNVAKAEEDEKKPKRKKKVVRKKK